MTLKLPDLPYAYDALAPFMSAETLAVPPRQASPGLCRQRQQAARRLQIRGPVARGHLQEGLCRQGRAGLINNVGQHYNHLHFWQWMKKGGGGKKLPGKLQTLVDKDLGGYDKMRTDFIRRAKASSAPAGPGSPSRTASSRS